MYHGFYKALQEVLTPNVPTEVICEIMALTNLSVPQAAYCMHFCRHEIDRGSTNVPSDNSLTDSDKFDDTIMGRLMHATVTCSCACTSMQLEFAGLSVLIKLT